MEKLIELANVGVKVSLWGPRVIVSGWLLTLERKDSGIELKITQEGNDVETVISEAYNKWLRATGRGLPTHTLNQIEHQPLADNEIPF